MTKDSRPERRYCAYAVVLLLTMGAVVATYVVELSQGKADPFNAVVLPLLALLLAGLTVGHGLRLLELLRARIRGIHDWAIASGRYG